MKYILLLYVFICIASGQNQDYEARIRALEEIVKKQSKRIEVLENENSKKINWKTLEQETEKKRSENISKNKTEKTKLHYSEKMILQYLEQIESINELRLGYDDGFFIKSYNSYFELHINGSMQAGIGIFENDTTDNNSIFLNSIYLSLETIFFNQWLARIEIDLNGFRDNGDGLFSDPEFFEPRIKDAYVQYITIPELQIRIGQTHVPFTIEGQYREHESMSIFSEPFIRSWSHGRDLGIMLLGTFADIIEYKASIHNGEGENKANQTDDFLLAGQLRFFPLKKSQNPDTFIHFGIIRNRDNRLKNDGDFGSAAMFTPWGRHVFGDNLNLNNGNLAQTQGQQTAFDVGLKIVMGGFWFESEFMFFEWERDLDTFGRLARVYGTGVSVGLRYLHNFTEKNDGSGLFTIAKFSYSDLDNYSSDNQASSIDGQTILAYTLGLGYSFNHHLWFQVNWIFLDVARAGVDPVDEDGDDQNDDFENAFFLQMTTVW